METIILTENLSKLNEIINTSTPDINELLKIACQNNKLKIIKYLTTRFPSFDFHYKELLEIASNNNNLEIIKYLCDNYKIYYTYIPFGLNASKNNSEIIHYLVEKYGVCYNLKVCPLIMSAFYGHFELVKYLVKKGFPIDTYYNSFSEYQPKLMTTQKNFESLEFYQYYGTPFYASIVNGHYEIANYLLKKGTNMRFNSEYLWEHLDDTRIDIVHYLISVNFFKNHDISLSDLIATKGSKKKIIKLLIEQIEGIDSHEYDLAVVNSVHSNDIEVLKILLESSEKIVINYNSTKCSAAEFYTNTINNAFLLASSLGLVNIIKLLIQYGADINFEKENLFRVAFPNRDTLDFLLSISEPLDISDNIVKILIERNCLDVVLRAISKTDTQNIYDLTKSFLKKYKIKKQINMLVYQN